MGIDLEKREAEKYKLDLIDGKNLLKINLRNVSIIEAILKIDSQYKGSFNVDYKPKGKYKGSTAYWSNELKKELNNSNTNKDKRYKEIITNLVFAIDREFSTHLNSDRVGREQISKRIITFEKEEIIENLKYPEKVNYSLFNKISEITVPKKEDKKLGINGKRNISFASKFCHFVCFYFFEDEKERDKYSIYDSTIKKVLRDYANHYIENYDRNLNLDNYYDYCACIDKIIEGAQLKEKDKISRNGFDHLLWYYHKGDELHG